MPQPAGPQDAEAFVGRSRELAVLSAVLHQAATGDARLELRDLVTRSNLSVAHAAARRVPTCCFSGR